MNNCLSLKTPCCWRMWQERRSCGIECKCDREIPEKVRIWFIPSNLLCQIIGVWKYNCFLIGRKLWCQWRELCIVVYKCWHICPGKHFSPISPNIWQSGGAEGSKLTSPAVSWSFKWSTCLVHYVYRAIVLIHTPWHSFWALYPFDNIVVLEIIIPSPHPPSHPGYYFHGNKGKVTLCLYLDHEEMRHNYCGKVLAD